MTYANIPSRRLHAGDVLSCYPAAPVESVAHLPHAIRDDGSVSAASSAITFRDGHMMSSPDSTLFHILTSWGRLMFTPAPCPTCQATSPCAHYAPAETWPLESLTPEDRRVQRQNGN